MKPGWLKMRWLALVVLGGALVWLGLGYKRVIHDEPGEHISQRHVRSIIAQESPVMFRDGKTRIGVFFAREHRAYLPFAEIPQAWLAAIVAAEDKRFWEHGGVDIWGIARAMSRNIRAGRMVAGGSTLTQQTAKNLYYRPDRSIKSKWTELLNALRLEARYSKEDIIEFYANQFHVSSNGRGLGIGARYFFDKTVDELDTLECAFLAGLVKAPARYNPFVGQTPEARSQARKRAMERTRYVLNRMLAEGFLTEAVHKDLTSQELVFQKGRFQYESNVVLDEVESRLSQAPFPALFASLDIDNPSTAGISIVTTLDEPIQRGATYGLWHHLSEIGPVLESDALAGFRLADNEAPRFDPSRKMAEGTFHAAKLAIKDPLTLQLPSGICLVDNEAIQRAADILARSKAASLWAKGGSVERAQVRELLVSGTPVMVSIRTTGEPAVCDLEQRPLLQGAVMVLENGRIRAMVGGNDNRNFNRAITARRQLGSIWKPVLYNAAMQLGWAPTDVVDNRTNVFHFEGTWYYPKADHDNLNWTSLAWLGTHSENLGSIWLMTHLTDHLGPQQFQRLAASLDLTRGESEEWMEFVRRIRDDEGVISTKERLPEIAFRAAQLEMLGDMDADDPETRALRSLFYGRGIEDEREKVVQAGQRVEEKTRALGRSYRALAAVGTTCLKQLRSLQARIQQAKDERDETARKNPQPGVVDTPDDSDSTENLEPWNALGFANEQLSCGQTDGDWQPIDGERWEEWVSGATAPPVIGDVRVNGEIRMGTLTRLHASMKRRILVWSAADPYEIDVLQYHPDYRILVGLRYMDKLARTFGVQDRLPPVLSMPLGAIDISLEEATTLYEGLMDGQTWSFPGETDSGSVESPRHSTQLIAEIRDRNDRVLYRAEPVPQPQTDPRPGRMVGDILRNVVQWGTGRRANGAVRIDDAIVPVAGKTGTTNGYRNAAFAGFVPKYDAGWTWAEGYAMAVYVGYDDNRSMRRKGVRIQGSNGALPVWIGTAAAMAKAGALGRPPKDTWARLAVDSGYSVVPVAEASGLPLADMPEEPGRSVLQAGTETVDRRFAPVGMAVPTSMDLVSPHGGSSTPTPEPAALDDWLGDEPASVWHQIQSPTPSATEGVIGEQP